MFGATDPGEALPGMRWRLGVPRVEEFSDFSCEKHWSRPLGFALLHEQLSQRNNSSLVMVETDSKGRN